MSKERKIEIREVATYYLLYEKDYPFPCMEYNGDSPYLTRQGKCFAFDRLPIEDSEEAYALRLLSGKMNYDNIQLTHQSWYPYEDKDRPKAELILDECGIKSYEVDRVTEDLQNQFVGDFSRDSSTILHVSQAPVSGGKRTFISSKDYSGKPGYYEFDTAKQALEYLGYEVVE